MEPKWPGEAKEQLTLVEAEINTAKLSWNSVDEWYSHTGNVHGTVVLAVGSTEARQTANDLQTK
jgi:hypothetical protein